MNSSNFPNAISLVLFNLLGFIKVDSCEQEGHAKNDIHRELELVWKKEATDDCCHDIGHLTRVLFDYVVQELENCCHYQTAHRSNEQREHEYVEHRRLSI